MIANSDKRGFSDLFFILTQKYDGLAVYETFNAHEFDSDRAYRFDELKSRAVMREFVAFLIFVILLFIVVYSNTNPNAFYYKRTLQDLIEYGSESSTSAFSDVRTEFYYSVFYNSDFLF